MRNGSPIFQPPSQRLQLDTELDTVGYSDTELDRVRAGNYVNYLGWWPSSEHHDGPVANNSTELAPSTIHPISLLFNSIHYLPMAMSALSRFVHASQHIMWVMWY